MFQGSMVALVTPMHEDGSLDEEALAGLIEFHVEAGTDAIVAVGTTGESATLSEHEHCDVVKKVVKLVNGRVPVIAGTGSNNTREAIELTQCAKDAGADACLLVTPYYNKPTQKGLIAHYTAIAEAVDIPQILYNVPGRTACDMLPKTVAVLSEIPNIVGIKEATGKSERCTELLKHCCDGFEVYSGDDITALDFVRNGAQGVISVTANVAPKAMHDMMMAALKDDFEQAEAIDRTLLGLHTDLFLEANPIPVKWAMAEMGKIGLGIRLPLTVLSAEYHANVRAAMKAAGAL